jgi:hypothetical protein
MRSFSSGEMLWQEGQEEAVQSVMSRVRDAVEAPM